MESLLLQNKANQLHNKARHRIEQHIHALVMAKRPPLRLPRCDISSTVRYPVNKRGKLPDTVAWNPTLKAAIDGMVLRGCWPDDDAKWVRDYTFTAATKDLPRGADPQLVITLTPVLVCEDTETKGSSE